MITLLIISNYKLFKRADVPGWHALVPFLNTWRVFEITYGKGIWMLLLLIPIYGIGLSLVTAYRFLESYDAEKGLCILEMFLPPVARAIVAFKDYEYAGYDEPDFKAPAAIGTGIAAIGLACSLILGAPNESAQGKNQAVQKQEKISTKQTTPKEEEVIPTQQGADPEAIGALKEGTAKEESFISDKDYEKLQVEVVYDTNTAILTNILITDPAGGKTEQKQAAFEITSPQKGEYKFLITGRDIEEATLKVSPVEKIKKEEPKKTSRPVKKPTYKKPTYKKPSYQRPTKKAPKKSSGDGDVSSTL